MHAFVSPCVAVRQPIHSIPRNCSRTENGVTYLGRTSFRGRGIPRCRPVIPSAERSTFRREALTRMFGGGGILGVGPSEVVVIVAVGWLLLGPEKLFSLAKDSGKLIGELRRTATEAKDTFSDALDVDLLAAELELKSKSKGTIEEEGLDGLAEKDEDEVPFVASTEPDAALKEALNTEVETENGTNDFLDQLRRVSDPNQVAPTELPDLSVDVEEMELERLEREYKVAKERLEARRQETNNAGGSGPLESANE